MLGSGRNAVTLIWSRRVFLVSLLIFVFSLLALMLLQHNYYNETYSEGDILRFQKTLHQKEELVRREFTQLEDSFRNNAPNERV